MRQDSTSDDTSPAFDAIVVGAGFGGQRMLHEFRQLGMSVRVSTGRYTSNSTTAPRPSRIRLLNWVPARSVGRHHVNLKTSGSTSA